MGPYSIDLRQRIVDAYNATEGSVREVAVRFKVAAKTVQNYLHLARTTGTVTPRPHAGGPAPKLDDAGVQMVRRLLEEKNDRTLNELADELAVRTSVRVSRSTLDRVLGRLGITRKKRRSVPANRTGRTSARSARASSRSSSKRIRGA